MADVVEVESKCFDWKSAENPDDGEKVEAEEAGLGGAAVCQDGVEGEAVADEANDDENCEVRMSVAIDAWRSCEG